MDISVVVPVYNVEKYLARCVESLLAQDYAGSYEVLLVNDGSTDGSLGIAQCYAQQSPELIRLFSKENGGLSDARNYGLARARGTYVSFVDSDDYVEPCFLSKMMAKAQETGADMVVCAYVIEDEGSGKVALRQKGGHAQFGTGAVDNPRLMVINSPYAWNKIYRRRLFAEHGIEYPKGLTYEDICTTYPLMVAASRIEKVEEPLVHYIQSRAGSITGTFNEKKLNVLPSLRLMVERCRSLIAERGLDESTLEPEVFLVCARHIYYRLRELSRYESLERCRSFVGEAFSFLGETFPSWEDDEQKLAILRAEKIALRDAPYWDRKVVSDKRTPKALASCASATRRLSRQLRRLRRLSKLSAHRSYLYEEFRKHCKVKENVALFESFHGKEVSDSPRVMAEELAKRADWKVFFTYNGDPAEQELDERIHLVKLYSLEYLYLLACAKLLVNSVSFPPFFTRREDQVYLNTWHGTPLKTLGKQMRHGVEDMNNIQRNFLQCTHLMYPDEFTERHMMEDYSLNGLYDGLLMECVYPRNERLALQGLAGADDKGPLRTIVYMPTWRGATSQAVSGTFSQTLAEVLSCAESTLGEDQTLYVKLHSLMRDSIDFSAYTKVRPFPQDESTYEFLAGCDALITDYSSVMFDFALSGRPVFVLAQDRAEYERERGTYFPIDELPFPVFDSVASMFERIVDPTGASDMSREVAATFGQFPYVPTEKIVRELIEGGESEFVRRVRAQKFTHAIICNGCRTPSDVERLSEYVRGLRHDSEANVIVLLRAVDFTDTLRDAIRENPDHVFDSFIVTKGKEARTYSQQLRRRRLARQERRQESALARFDRYLSHVPVGKIVFFDAQCFGPTFAEPVEIATR